MRTTVILKDDLVKKAMEATGIKEKTALLHRGLEVLIQQQAIKRLIQLGGSERSAKAPLRRRAK